MGYYISLKPVLICLFLTTLVTNIASGQKKAEINKLRAFAANGIGKASQGNLSIEGYYYSLKYAKRRQVFFSKFPAMKNKEDTLITNIFLPNGYFIGGFDYVKYKSIEEAVNGPRIYEGHKNSWGLYRVTDNIVKAAILVKYRYKGFPRWQAKVTYFEGEIVDNMVVDWKLVPPFPMVEEEFYDHSIIPDTLIFKHSAAIKYIVPQRAYIHELLTEQ